MRHIIESCDGSGCTRTREFRLTGTNSMPQDGRMVVHIVQSGGDGREDGPPPMHITKSACSPECATRAVGVMLATSKSDLTIEFCFGHKDQKGH